MCRCRHRCTPPAVSGCSRGSAMASCLCECFKQREIDLTQALKDPLRLNRVVFLFRLLTLPKRQVNITERKTPETPHLSMIGVRFCFVTGQVRVGGKRSPTKKSACKADRQAQYSSWDTVRRRFNSCGFAIQEAFQPTGNRPLPQLSRHPCLCVSCFFFCPFFSVFRATDACTNSYPPHPPFPPSCVTQP